MSKWFCLKKKSKKRAKAKSTEERLKLCADEINTFSFEEKPINIKVKDSNTISTSILSSFASDLEKLNLTEERLKRYAYEADTLSSDTTVTSNTENELRTKVTLLREKAISKTLNSIKLSMKVDLCFVLDCTNSMGPYIAAARDYILQSVLPYGGGDTPEDVLGGLNEAITKMNWKNGTRVLLHIGDSPPHGKKFIDMIDDYLEPKLHNMEYKRFNANTGVITELRHILEAFVHFTYEYTKGYLVVCDLQGIELTNEFLLTDPAIHCIDSLRFGSTNFGKEGINQLFLANHRCNDICKQLKLKHINNGLSEDVA
ncbi:unnamed protein product [Rhizophagus irregularis]|nr:unnamed protein product [Rhizophagus irregularis]CAB4403432.1 unnamed protein product [Rhizophagus irregularis]